MRFVPFSSLGCGSEKVSQISLTSPSAKKVLDEFNFRAQEGHVVQSFFLARLGTAPKPVAFDVHADEIPFRMPTGKAYGVLAFATTQLQDDGVIVAENLLRPAPLVQTGPVHNGFEIRFEHVGKCRVLLPFTELVLAHEVRNYAS